MSNTAANTLNVSTPVQVQWNTGRKYTARGQRIVARQLDDGTIAFRDLDRSIDGILTEKSGVGGADRGADEVFAPMKDWQIRHLVEDHYCNDYKYRDQYGLRQLAGFDWV